VRTPTPIFPGRLVHKAPTPSRLVRVAEPRITWRFQEADLTLDEFGGFCRSRRWQGRILVIRRTEGLITFKVEIEREDDGRWLAEVVELPGVLAYGETQETALSRVQALALRVIAERLEHGEAGPDLLSISFNAA
jgi:predicted RNase H-like HicB family nuclease